MVVVSPSFTLLVSISSFAALSMLPGNVDAVAIPPLTKEHEPTQGEQTLFGSSASSDHNANDSGSARLLPLPIRAADSQVRSRIAIPKGYQKVKAERGETPRSWDPTNPLLELGNIWIRSQLRQPRHNHDTVIVSGDDDHVHIHDSHHHHGDKVVISGDNDHVHVHRSPKPRNHHHHHHHHHHGHGNDKVIVSGDHDRVNVHMKRGPSDVSIPLLDKERAILVPKLSRREHHHRHHHHHNQHSNDDHDKLVVSGDHDVVHAHMRRQFSAEGVPGTIDIMSAMTGSDAGQRLASLMLASAAEGGSATPGDPFVLNASGSNQTQVYLVVTSSNGTDSSNSTDPVAYHKVAVQIPVFDPEEAIMKSYCATFDPKPSAPSPLTVESCMNGTEADEHKSQVFAYNPSDGTIQPMWFEGEDDGMSPNDESDGEDDDSADLPGMDGSDQNSTSTTSVDPPTVTDSAFARLTQLNSALLDDMHGDATVPAKVAQLAQSLAADHEYANGQNVTLVFSPAAPVISKSAASSMKKIASANDSSSTLEAPASTATASTLSSDTVSTTITFSSASATLVSSATTTSSEATSTDSMPTSSATAHGLAVEVFDPSAVLSTSDPTATPTASSTLSSSTPTMTPVSTSPYEWMFRKSVADDKKA